MMELKQMVHSVLKTQIEFGIYRFGESLPIMDDASQLLLVSVDTIRAAYLLLQQEGYITLTKNVGAKVKAQYDAGAIEGNIQSFFSSRKTALMDLGRSMGILLSRAQWLGLKNASPVTLDRMASLVDQGNIFPPYMMAQHLQMIYGALRNELLMRLVWQTFMFFQAPFLSLPENLQLLTRDGNPLLELVGYCRDKDWAGLQGAVDAYQGKLCFAIHRFYETRITAPAPGEEMVFSWSSYKKPSQICYSLGKELMVALNEGRYPAGTFLPSLERLAKEKDVSVSTIRRTLALLNGIGATKSINGVGTQLLPLEKCADNCDFSAPAVRKRLTVFTESLHFLALSCRAAARVTVASIEPSVHTRWKERLGELKRTGRYDWAAFVSLEYISLYAPYHAVRIIYAELVQQLMWGHPLWSIRRNLGDLKASLIPRLDVLAGCLEQADAAGFAAVLEELVTAELKFAVGQLTRLGIHEANALLIPDAG